MTQINTDKIGSLLEKVEHSVDYDLRTPNDFLCLQEDIFHSTKERISATTLKRLWGYLGEKEKVAPSRTTQNILAQFIGYVDWETFCQRSSFNEDVDSDFMTNTTITAASLQTGDKLRLRWHPDRMLLVEYMGVCRFQVLESLNSKLSVGDTFTCAYFINKAPLYLVSLVHEGGAPTCYVCGKACGVLCDLVK